MPDSRARQPGAPGARAAARARVDGAAARTTACCRSRSRRRRSRSSGRSPTRAACCSATTTATPHARRPRSTASSKQFPQAKVVFEPGTDVSAARRLVPTSALDDRRRRARPRRPRSSRSPTSAATPIETRIDAASRAWRRTGRGLRLRAAEDAGAADALDRLPDARRVGHLPPRRRGLGQPAATSTARSSSTPRGGFPPPPSVVDVPLEKGRRYAIRVEMVPRFIASAHLVWMPPKPDIRGTSRGRGARGGRGRRRRRHHLRPRGRGERRRPARLQGRRPHAGSTCRRRSRSCSRP